jgi:hypothetical protein
MEQKAEEAIIAAARKKTDQEAAAKAAPAKLEPLQPFKPETPQTSPVKPDSASPPILLDPIKPFPVEPSSPIQTNEPAITDLEPKLPTEITPEIEPIPKPTGGKEIKPEESVIEVEDGKKIDQEPVVKADENIYVYEEVLPGEQNTVITENEEDPVKPDTP